MFNNGDLVILTDSAAVPKVLPGQDMQWQLLDLNDFVQKTVISLSEQGR